MKPEEDGQFSRNQIMSHLVEASYLHCLKRANQNLTLPGQIAKLFKDVYDGGNWTSVNVKGTLASVTWEQATTKVGSFNTIAALVYHINYYVSALIKVLNAEQLDARDRYSFDHPPILSEKDWEDLLNKTWADAETFASLVENLPENKLWEDFWGNKYGNYFRNIHGVIEHTHYHLGQIVLIKKMLSKASEDQP